MNLQDLLKCPVADVDHDSTSAEYHAILHPDAVNPCDVAEALPLLVSKVSAAVRMGLPRAGALFTAIIHAACCSNAEEVALRLASERSNSSSSGGGAGQQRVLHQLVDITSLMLEATDLTGWAIVPPVDGTLRHMLEILQLLASEIPVKDDLGEAMIPLLMSILQKMATLCRSGDVETNLYRKGVLRNYELHRVVASTLINLFRGSKKNKLLALPYASGVIVPVMERSLDYYLQMQSGEMLFRLYTFDRDAFESASTRPRPPPSTAAAAAAAAGGVSIPLHVKEGLRAIKNTPEQLLGGIENMLQRVHAHQQLSAADHRRRGGGEEEQLLKLDVIHVDVIGGHSPPPAAAPAESAGTTTSLCGPTVLHFNPLFLVFLIPHAIGTQVTVAYEDIRSVRISKDHKISLRLKNTPPYISDRLSEVRGPAAATRGGARDDGLDVLQLSVTTSTIEALKHSPVMQWISEAKKMALETAAAAPHTLSGPRHALDDGSVQQQPPHPTRGAMTTASHRRGNASSSVAHADDASRPTERPSAEKRPRSASATSHTAVDTRGGRRGASRQSTAVPEDASVDGHITARVEQELRSAIAARIEQRSEFNRSILSKLLSDVQAEVNNYRSDVSEWRDELELSERASLAVLKQSASEFKQFVRTNVREMNEELDDLKRLADVVKANLDASIEGAASLRVETKAAEKSMLVELKDVVDTQLGKLEEEMTAFVEHSNASLLGKVMRFQAHSNIKPVAMTTGSKAPANVAETGKRM